MSRQCTCITDKEATCIVHPTTQSLKDYIAELEVQELGLIHSLRELLADNKRLKEAITEFLDTDPYYECTEKALRKLEEAGS